MKRYVVLLLQSARGVVVLSWGPRFARSDRILHFLHVQVGSPNLSVYAVLAVDIDHKVLKERW